MLAELDRPLSRPTWFGAAMILLSLSIEQSQAYSSGAPSSACSSMIPSHPGSPQPTATSPYMVYVSSGRYAPGGQLTVTINGTQQFKGFLLMARTSPSSSSVGTFVVASSSKQACGGGLTHTSSASISSLSVQWTAPASSQGPVQFYATVVQSAPVYWVALSSNIVSESLSSTASTTATSTVRTTSSSGASIIPLTKALAGCGATSSCFSSPSGCAGSDCNYLLVWRPLPAGAVSSISLLQFQLQGRTTATPGYVSVGFGQSQSMNGLSVVNCVATNSGATVTQTYSSRNAEPAFLNVASNLQNVTAASSADFVQCSFVWNNNARTSVQQYDLTASYYLVMARGPAVGNAAGNIMRHAENPIYLSDRITIASTLNADYPLRLTAFSTDEPNRATESRWTVIGTRGTEVRFNMTGSSSGSTPSRVFSMKLLLVLLSCVIALAI